MRFTVGILALSAMLCVNANAAPINRVVAVVNGDMITEFDLNRMVAPVLLRAKLDPRRPSDAGAVAMIRKEVLQGQIRDAIVVQEAERLHVKVDESEIDATLAEIRGKSKMTEAEFINHLETQKISMTDFRSEIRRNLLNRHLLGHMVARKVVITKEEVEAYYKSHQEQFTVGRDVHLAMLVYPPNARVDLLSEAILKGKASFEGVVRRVSIGPMKENGGDLGVLPWSDLSPSLREALNGMKAGDVSAPFDLNGMQAQVKLIGIKEGSGEILPLEKVGEQIETVLRGPRVKARFDEYMEQLRQRAVVDVRL